MQDLFENAKANRYRNEVNDAFYATPDKYLAQVQDRQRELNSMKYQDFLKTRPELTLTDTYFYGINPGQAAYSDKIRAENKDAYDQFEQYQNQQFNEFYKANPKGSALFDTYNPYILRPVPMVMPTPYQDYLGAWNMPNYGSPGNPGLGFDQFYTDIYSKPGYQRLSGITKIDPGFDPSRMFGSQGMVPRHRPVDADTLQPLPGGFPGGFFGGMTPGDALGGGLARGGMNDLAMTPPDPMRHPSAQLDTALAQPGAGPLMGGATSAIYK